LKSPKEDGERNHHAEVKFSGRTPSQFGQRSLRSESSGQNSPWRDREVMRTIGSIGAIWMVRSIHEGSAKLQESLDLVELQGD
jgi:hypothetical protein